MSKKMLFIHSGRGLSPFQQQIAKAAMDLGWEIEVQSVLGRLEMQKEEEKEKIKYFFDEAGVIDPSGRV